jgi:GTP-binding protein
MGDHALGASGEEQELTPADEAGRLLFAQECRFLAAAADVAALPLPSLPEVAFAGRSNVGKSSLVNALTGRRTLARTSNTPGRTRSLNFFDLAGRLTLVDMPGYGYAAGSKQMVASWGKLIRLYLRGRPGLVRTLLLIDARHGLKDLDREVMDLLDETAVVYQVVLTKADKLPPAVLDQELGRTAAVLARRPAAHPSLIATSARTGLGIAALRAELAALALAAPS